MAKFLPLFLLLFVGCRKDHHDRTPAGWLVEWRDQGTLAEGRHTLLELYQLFDAAMERSFPECAAKVGLPESYVRSRIKKNDALYTLVDNFYFPVAPGSADAPEAVYASGITYSRFDVWVAFYSKAGGLTFLPKLSADIPPWTIKHGETTGLWYWGVEAEGGQYPALGYELGWQFTTNPNH